MIDLAQESERLGYKRIFFTDHLMNPYGGTSGYAEETVETWALLAYLAAETETIRLGTGVSPMALRPPALLAKQVSTVDNLSGGRIDFGIGTGWSERSFGAIDTDFGDPASRKARLREGIDLILELWSSDTAVDFDGEYYKSHGAVIGPKPVQHPRPPLWVGGWRQNMLAITAEVGDGWIPWNRTVEFYEKALGQIRAQAEPLGRADDIVYGTGVLVVPEGGVDTEMAQSHSEQPPLTTKTIKEWSDRFEDVGCELLLMMVLPDPQDSHAVLHQVAEELM
jgi:phthiodiolone/phenolphthiodiolone dimycocerosates ketoreductase